MLLLAVTMLAEEMSLSVHSQMEVNLLVVLMVRVMYSSAINQDMMNAVQINFISIIQELQHH
jgi:hypothetical protein